MTKSNALQSYDGIGEPAGISVPSHQKQRLLPIGNDNGESTCDDAVRFQLPNMDSQKPEAEHANARRAAARDAGERDGGGTRL